MRMMFALVAIGLTVVVSAQPGPAPRTVPGEQARALIIQLVDSPVSQAMRSNVPEHLRESFANSVRWLSQARIPEQVPAGLVRTLKVDIDLLSTANSRPSAKEAASIDIIWKGELCRNSPDGLGATIAVSVRTLLKDAESKNWEVVYKTAPEMEDPKIPPTPFPTFSSPTIDNLPAALYHFWARDPKDANKKGVVREVPVRTAGVSVDLLAPQ